MVVLRLYLLAGLLFHKAVWELMKARRSSPAPATAPAPLRLRLVKAAKVGVLLAIIAQTLMPGDVLPLTLDAILPRVLGTAIYSLGLAVAISARVLLGSNWSDIESAGVLPGQAVVVRGPYRFVRHPIYMGDLLLLLGLELALNSWLVLLVVALAPPVLYSAVREERLLLASLPGYGEYCRRTKRFVPFLV